MFGVSRRDERAGSSASPPSASSERANASATTRATNARHLTAAELVACASNCLADAIAEGRNDETGSFAKINEARRMIERVREIARSGGADAEEAREALDGLEELANDAVNIVSDGMFVNALATPMGGGRTNATVTASPGLDLFSGLTLNATPTSTVTVAANEAPPSVSPESISPHVLFGGDEHVATPDSSWRPDKPRIGYGRRDASASAEGLFGSLAVSETGLEMSPISRAVEMEEVSPAPVFDEVIDVSDGAFEFAVATPAESFPTPSAGVDAEDGFTELQELLKSCDIRFKPAKLAYDSAEARRLAATSRRKHSAEECAKLLETITNFKCEQDDAIAQDDFERAERLEATIIGARESYTMMEVKLFAAESECTSFAEEAAKALKTWIEASAVSVADVSSFCESKRRELAEKNSVRDQKFQIAAASREARRNALEASVAEAENTITELTSAAVAMGRVKADLLPPIEAMKAEIESMRSALAAKESELAALENEVSRTEAEEEDLCRRIEEAKRTDEAARRELEQYDETNGIIESRVPDASEVTLEKVTIEAEAAMALLREEMSRNEGVLSSTERSLQRMGLFIERELVARERMTQAARDLEHAKDARSKAEAHGEREFALEARLAELERAKATAVSEKRFRDAQTASEEIKRLQSEQETCRGALDSIDTQHLDDRISDATGLLQLARTEFVRARLERLRAEQEASEDARAAALGAIELLRLSSPIDGIDFDDEDA